MTAETPWRRYDNARLISDSREITTVFPGLSPAAGGAGIGWHGRLPIWPFARAAPCQFESGVRGLDLLMLFPQSYPMTMPHLHPLDPEPEFHERTQHRWHVNGDGSLCLIQEQRTWTGRGSVVDLLLKAAAWRLEYGLVRAGVFEYMSENGIVSDSSRDTEIAALFGATT
ncbi:hypothetical protein [Microbacterium sp. KSW4-4]|uniref:hypothetical protein n=1 Tax=Microbacterium sp. KSW4-4 TaxID=2851651 RepID=UPI001FFCD69E|nr:hypothetical protein [Microbacterium sp. KSW4-4]MCK2032202.1 hypothetical protein [Microbacterium sp. KSW4-4]